MRNAKPPRPWLQLLAALLLATACASAPEPARTPSTDDDIGEGETEVEDLEVPSGEAEISDLAQGGESSISGYVPDPSRAVVAVDDETPALYLGLFLGATLEIRFDGELRLFCDIPVEFPDDEPWLTADGTPFEIWFGERCNVNENWYAGPGAYEVIFEAYPDTQFSFAGRQAEVLLLTGDEAGIVVGWGGSIHVLAVPPPQALLIPRDECHSPDDFILYDVINQGEVSLTPLISLGGIGELYRQMEGTRDVWLQFLRYTACATGYPFNVPIELGQSHLVHQGTAITEPRTLSQGTYRFGTRFFLGGDNCVCGVIWIPTECEFTETPRIHAIFDEFEISGEPDACQDP